MSLINIPTYPDRRGGLEALIIIIIIIIIVIAIVIVIIVIRRTELAYNPDPNTTA